MNIFNENQSVGEVVAIMPKASDIFIQYNIDFCCGGHRLLGDVVEKQNLNKQEVLEKLEEAYVATMELTQRLDFRKMPLTDLIDYIINRHHVYLKEALPQLSELTRKTMKVHGLHHRNLFEVHKLYHLLKIELDQHMIKEEERLFPLIRDYSDCPSERIAKRIRTILEELEDEHETAGNVLKELRKVTSDYQVPEDGCSTYTATFDRLKELELDLFEHIHLENNILFKNFTKVIYLSQSVYDICKENPDVIDIMKELGFESITSLGMLNTAGRFMTIPKGALMKKISMDTVKEVFVEKGYELEEGRNSNERNDQ